MALAQEDIDFIKNNLGLWLSETSLGKTPMMYVIQLSERMVRVEEALKHQRLLMRQGFDLIEKRCEQIEKRLDNRLRAYDELVSLAQAFAECGLRTCIY